MLNRSIEHLPKYLFFIHIFIRDNLIQVFRIIMIHKILFLKYLIQLFELEIIIYTETINISRSTCLVVVNN